MRFWIFVFMYKLIPMLDCVVNVIWTTFRNIVNHDSKTFLNKFPFKIEWL
jgi:hypothetical protein